MSHTDEQPTHTIGPHNPSNPPTRSALLLAALVALGACGRKGPNERPKAS